MKKLIAGLGLGLFVSVAAVADTGTSISKNSSLEYAKPLRQRIAVEVAASMTGSMGSNTVKTSYSDQQFISDHSFSIAARKYFNESMAIGLSFDFYSAMSDGGRDISQKIDQGIARQTYLHPILVGFRYQGQSLADSSLLKPYFELGVGPTFTRTPRYQGNTDTVHLSARPSVGLDIFFSESTRYSVGFKTGYLFVNQENLSNFQSSVTLGYLF